jgi:hypothetical protein
MEIWNIWHVDYWLAGSIKALSRGVITDIDPAGQMIPQR